MLRRAPVDSGYALSLTAIDPALGDAPRIGATAIAEATRLGQLARAAYAGTKARLRQTSADLIRHTFEADVKSVMQR